MKSSWLVTYTYRKKYTELSFDDKSEAVIAFINASRMSSITKLRIWHGNKNFTKKMYDFLEE